MATERGSVWGNEVRVPPGEKINPNAAQHVTVEGADTTKTNEGGGTGDGGADTTKTNEGGGTGDGNQTQTFDVPTVVMPDGTTHKVEEFDPFVQQRQDIERREARVDGYMAAVNGDGTGEGDGNGGNTTNEPPKNPLLDDNPLLEEITISDDDADIYSEAERRLIEENNNLKRYAREQNQTIATQQTEFQQRIDRIADTVGDRFFRDDMARVTAQTGVTEAEIAAANRATGVTDIETLATIVLGSKAQQQQQEEAQQQADEERTRGAGAIGGQTRNTGSGGGEGNQEEGRGVSDWTNAQEVGAKYQFGRVD